MRVLFASFVAVAVLLLAGCGSGDDEPPTTATATPSASDATPSASLNSTSDTVRQEIERAISRVYELLNEDRFEDVYRAYTSAWQARCSLDDMVDAMNSRRASGVQTLRVIGFSDVQYIGDRGSATYTVAGVDGDGRQTASYEYTVEVQREDGAWKLEEACF